MGIRIDRGEAQRILIEQAEIARDEDSKSPRVAETNSPDWEALISGFSHSCDQANSKTHIAFLGTEILAKCLEPRVDLYAIKPNHDKKNSRAYSARSLCHQVLVPLSAELGFDIGVSGREPLNNQPYFRMTRLGDDTPVRANAAEAFGKMLGIIQLLDSVKTKTETKKALRAYIKVRRKYHRTYGSASPSDAPLEIRQFSNIVYKFVQANSEGGKRAQAVVAGILDVFAPGLVISGRINDPDRRSPGDVCLLAQAGSDQIGKAFEVRDKPVSLSDAHIFGRKCMLAGVTDVAIVLASPSQERLSESLDDWAEKNSIFLRLFYGWEDLISEVFFWASIPTIKATASAAATIDQRLVEVEASVEGVELWRSYCSGMDSLDE